MRWSTGGTFTMGTDDGYAEEAPAQHAAGSVVFARASGPVCRRYRPAARSPQTPDTSTCHVGFRCGADGVIRHR
jgi:formylglycine-generating enzyme required for sulfatase activity